MLACRLPTVPGWSTAGDLGMAHGGEGAGRSLAGSQRQDASGRGEAAWGGGLSDGGRWRGGLPVHRCSAYCAVRVRYETAGNSTSAVCAWRRGCLVPTTVWEPRAAKPRGSGSAG